MGIDVTLDKIITPVLITTVVSCLAPEYAEVTVVVSNSVASDNWGWKRTQLFVDTLAVGFQYSDLTWCLEAITYLQHINRIELKCVPVGVVQLSQGFPCVKLTRNGLDFSDVLYKDND